MQLVPNKELREAFIRSGLTTMDVANFCGWLRKSGKPDATKVGRALGILEQRNRNGRMYTNTRTSEEIALKIIKALNLDPVDFRDIGL